MSKSYSVNELAPAMLHTHYQNMEELKVWHSVQKLTTPSNQQLHVTSTILCCRSADVLVPMCSPEQKDEQQFRGLEGSVLGSGQVREWLQFLTGREPKDALLYLRKWLREAARKEDVQLNNTRSKKTGTSHAWTLHQNSGHVRSVLVSQIYLCFISKDFQLSTHNTLHCCKDFVACVNMQSLP